jgi:hypothetical protein
MDRKLPTQNPEDPKNKAGENLPPAFEIMMLHILITMALMRRPMLMALAVMLIPRYFGIWSCAMISITIPAR